MILVLRKLFMIIVEEREALPSTTTWLFAQSPVLRNEKTLQICISFAI